MENLHQQLCQLLENNPHVQIRSGFIPAAVLIPLFLHNRSWHVIYTRRSDQLSSHQGQVAFPGGRVDTGRENARTAALREAREEIGLHPGDVNIMGNLPAQETGTGFIIHPFVATLPWPYPLHANSEEVSRIFSIPLCWLMDKQHQRHYGGRHPQTRANLGYTAFKPYSGDILWGATARMTMNLIRIIKQIDETR